VRRVLGAALLALAACATTAKDQTICPEYRTMVCPAGATCSMDTTRGCRVCQCNAINGTEPMSPPDTPGVPPR
jgi:hypothetical protein